MVMQDKLTWKDKVPRIVEVSILRMYNGHLGRKGIPILVTCKWIMYSIIFPYIISVK